MNLLDLIRKRRKKNRVPAVPPGNPPGDFREWQRNRAVDNAKKRTDQDAAQAPSRMPRATRLQMLVEMWPHPGGGQWTAGEIEEATDGEVPPGLWFAAKEGRTTLLLTKVKAILDAMDLPFDLWMRPRWWWKRTYGAWKSGTDVEDKLHDRSYDGDISRPRRLLLEWGYVSPTCWEKSSGEIFHHSLDFGREGSSLQLCSISEAAELLQITDSEIEEMLYTEELEGVQGEEGWNSVNLRSVVRKTEPGA